MVLDDEEEEEEVLVVVPAAELRSLVEPLLASAGLELWDVEITRDSVRIFVDRDGGIDLDALSAASAALSGVLDDHEDVVPAGRYQLEISSPGLERTLRTPEQYRRYVGTPVSIKTAIAIGGARRHRGTLVSAGDAGCELQPDTGGEVIELGYDQIERARTVFEWGPAPKPGSRPAASPSRRTAGRKAATAPDPKDVSP